MDNDPTIYIPNKVETPIFGYYDYTCKYIFFLLELKSFYIFNLRLYRLKESTKNTIVTIYTMYKYTCMYKVLSIKYLNRYIQISVIIYFSERLYNFIVFSFIQI